jgi:hypothetical protein
MVFDYRCLSSLDVCSVPAPRKHLKFAQLLAVSKPGSFTDLSLVNLSHPRRTVHLTDNPTQSHLRHNIFLGLNTFQVK